MGDSECRRDSLVGHIVIYPLYQRISVHTFNIRHVHLFPRCSPQVWIGRDVLGLPPQSHPHHAYYHGCLHSECDGHETGLCAGLYISQQAFDHWDNIMTRNSQLEMYFYQLQYPVHIINIYQMLTFEVYLNIWSILTVFIDPSCPPADPLLTPPQAILLVVLVPLCVFRFGVYCRER